MEEETKRKKLLELYNEYKDCEKCLLHKVRVNFVFGKGNPDNRIMLIGEAPGSEEDIEGFPFVGKSGSDLFSALGSVGIKKTDVFTTNIIKCRPTGNSDPSEEEIEACNELLYNQIKIIDPNIIILVGKIALDSFFSGLKITEVCGRYIVNAGKIWFFLIHPAALFRNGKLKPRFDSGIKNLKQLLDMRYHELG